MILIGFRFPPGFTITTEACIEYNKLGAAKLREILDNDVHFAIKHIEDIYAYAIWLC